MRVSHKVALNTFVQVLGKVVSAGITLVITVFIARAYGVVGYGDFTKVTTYIALFYLVADFGFNAVVLKYITLKPKEENFYFQNLLALRFLFALLLTVAAVLLAVVLPYNPVSRLGFTPLVKVGIFILSFSILTQAVFTTINLIFQRELRYDKSVVASIVGSVVNLLVLVLLIYYHVPLLLALLSFVIGSAFMAGLGLYLVGVFKRLRFETTIDFYLWKKIFKETWPLGITLVFNLIYFRADTFILTYFRSTQEVGIYGLAYKFFEFPLTIPVFFMNGVYPILLKELRSRNNELRIIKKSFIFLLFSSLVFILASLLVSPLLAWIKTDFAYAIIPFRILSLSLPLFFLSPLFMWVLIAHGKLKLLSIFYGFSMVVNIVLNLIFIPGYGYMAAAVITGVSEFMVLLATGAASYKILTKIRIPKSEYRNKDKRPKLKHY